jgi:CHASE2 domain-containing sensor protein
MQPRVIGLDLYRNNPIHYRDRTIASSTDLPTYLRQTNRVIHICKVSSESDQGTASFPDIPWQNLGFSNVLVDSNNTETGPVRRLVSAFLFFPALPDGFQLYLRL